MKAYEQTNHLGNVLVTVSDARQISNSGSNVTGFVAIVKSATDYSAFGAPMAGRTYTSNAYRYSFNGKEKESEIASGDLDFGARIYDCRLGRWFSRDPMARTYPESTPYAFVRNSPIGKLDIDGKWDIEVHACEDRSTSDGTGCQYGIAIVRDNAGNEIYRMEVKMMGTAGRDRTVTNSDTPCGTYNITGWEDHSDDDRAAYGPNELIEMTPKSGEVVDADRSGIWIHGGRQETLMLNSDGVTYEWTRDENPELSHTHGCMRAFDSDLAELKAITDNLEATDPNEAPGTVTVTNDLVYQDGDYYAPCDIDQYTADAGQSGGALTNSLLTATTPEQFQAAFAQSVDNYNCDVDQAYTTL